jgi:two-component system, response regulator
VFMSQPTNGTDGVFFPWRTMGLGLNRSSQNKSSDSLNGYMAVTSIRAVASVWPYANAWWSNTAGGFGWINPRLAEDPPSASPYPPMDDRSQSKVSGDTEPRTVLVVEDNPTDVFVIREVIERCNLNVSIRVAADGQDALRYLQQLAKLEESACPALVLLDLNVPKVDGIEVLRRLRNSSRCSTAPVIVVTSSTAEADRIAAERLGAEAYFQKPTSLTAYMELAELIKRFLPPA